MKWKDQNNELAETWRKRSEYIEHIGRFGFNNTKKNEQLLF
jgi:hypothetical protein